jgi:hypothetical protein
VLELHCVFFSPMSGGSHNTSTGLLLKFVCPKFEEVLDDLDMKRDRIIAIMCHAI